MLKGFHGFRLEALFDTYPDANLLWLHRDPVQVAASRTMMMADILDGIVGPIDLQAAAKMHLELTRASITNTMTHPMVRDPRIMHTPTPTSSPINRDRGRLLRLLRTGSHRRGPGRDAGLPCP